jgi:hypothetical protein
MRLTESETAATAAFELDVKAAAAAVLDDDEYLRVNHLVSTPRLNKA